MPAGNRENPLLKEGNSDAFFREKCLTKNTHLVKPSLAQNSVDYYLLHYEAVFLYCTENRINNFTYQWAADFCKAKYGTNVFLPK